MRVAIVEDETVAAQALEALIKEVENDVEVDAVLQSIEESVAYFSRNPKLDLVFMDIHLADGSSFSIFDEVVIDYPVIFTTAYDEYALKAFHLNSIDYLLKPISKNELERAIKKFQHLSSSAHSDNKKMLNELLSTLKGSRSQYRNHFLVPYKDKLVPLAVSDVAYIYIENKIVKAISFEQRTYYLENTLDEIMETLDPSLFFRANRQFIVAHKAIKDISLWFGSKLSLNLILPVPEKVVVSKAKVSEFKSWYAG